MSYQGLNSKSKTHQFISQTLVPSNPREGDVYRDSGANRAAGLYQYVNSAWTPIGSGSGEYDFLSSKTIANYVAYNDGASAVPVDGTGGTASYVSVASSPSPISNQAGIVNLRITKTANAAQGEGISVDFATRGLIDRAAVRVCKINILSSANFVDNDFGVYLYDVTNSRIIYPADQNLKASSFVSRQQFSFQLSPDSDSYRLIFHNQTTSALAYTLDLTVSIVEQKVGSGTVETDYTACTMTCGLTGATGLTVKAFEKRSGDVAFYKGKISWSAVFTGGTATINLPSGRVIDTVKQNSKVEYTKLGTAQLIDSGSASYFGDISYNTTTQVVIKKSTVASSNIYLDSISTTTPITWANADSIEFDFSVPIAGWSSNTVMSEDSGNRLIAATIYLGSAANHTSSGAYQKTPLAAVERDTTGSWDAVNARWVVPETGDYHVDFSSGLNSIADTKYAEAALYVNGVLAISGSMVPGGAAAATVSVGSKTIYLIKGQYLELYTTQNDGASEAYITSNETTFISIHKVASPQAIAASEEVMVRVGGDPASASSGNPIIFPTKAYDTHSAYNTTTGQFAAPRAGFVRVHGFITSANNNVNLNIYVAGSSVITAGNTQASGEGNFSGTVKVSAGQLVDLRPDATLDAATGSVIHFEMV